MKLRLSRLSTIEDQGAFASHQDSSHEFTELGGTLGRSSHNDWVIPDPTRVVSGTHARFDFLDGQFWLTDTSTNGVYVNGSDVALGRGNRVPLATGDWFQIGDFAIAVIIDDESLGHDSTGQFDKAYRPAQVDSLGDGTTIVNAGPLDQKQPYTRAAQSHPKSVRLIGFPMVGIVVAIVMLSAIVLVIWTFK